jgi:hypothetical protein
VTKEPPFSVSPEAMRWLMELPTFPDKQPGFFCSPRFGVYRGAELIEEYLGDHFSFGFAPPDEWLGSREAMPYTIGGRPFWITDDILTRLSGATLSVIETDVACGEHPACWRRFLIPS